MTDLTDIFKPGDADFGFRLKPFRGAEAEFFFTNTNHLDAYIQLLQGIRQQKNLTVLTGEAGTGKTLLLRKFVREAPAHIQCVFCYSTNLDFDELLTVICDQLGLATQELDQPAKLEALKEYVHIHLVQQMAVALIIDDAHNLCREVLNRLLTLVYSDPPEGCPVQIVLSGTPGLEDVLAQRQATYSPGANTVHIHLDRLADTDVGAFIRRQMQSAGGPLAETLFPTPVIECIAHYAHGILRLINKLCDRTLLVAHLNGQSTLSTELVDEAASQLLLQKPALQKPASVGGLETASLPGVQSTELGRKRLIVVGIALVLALISFFIPLLERGTALTSVTYRSLVPGTLAPSPSLQSAVSTATTNRSTEQLPAPPYQPVPVAETTVPALAAVPPALERTQPSTAIAQQQPTVIDSSVLPVQGSPAAGSTSEAPRVNFTNPPPVPEATTYPLAPRLPAAPAPESAKQLLPYAKPATPLAHRAPPAIQERTPTAKNQVVQRKTSVQRQRSQSPAKRPKLFVSASASEEGWKIRK